MQKTFIDQLNREVIISYPPERIISLVPSQTELLFELGLFAEISGITDLCVHPAAMHQLKTKVGETKKLNIDLIRELNPDLIIGSRETNTPGDIALLSKEFPVWMSDVHNLEEAMNAITQIAELVDRQPEAAYLNHLINAGFTDLQTLALQQGIDKKVAYLLWKDPYMAAGTHTFVHDILTKIGLRNVIRERGQTSLDLKQLQELQPELIFLASEPFAFQEEHMKELQLAVPGARIMLVDGQIFSWHGSRLVKAVQYLFQLQPQLN